MTTLLNEYCNRHGSKFVVPTNDGLCFFNDHKRPAMVALTSTTPKSYQTCYRCGCENSWITLELFTPNKDNVFICVYHDHIHPDTDICAKVKSLSGNIIPYTEPAYLKHGREVETWLWNFFLFHSRLRRSRSWLTWSSMHTTTTEPLCCYEQMTYCAINHPNIFKLYYTMYQVFVAGRKYLLFE